MKSPAGAELRLSNARLATAIAEEWRRQGDQLMFHAMPLTRLAFAAIDRVSANREAAIEQIVAFGKSDVVCYRAGAPSDLVERQSRTWDPLLRWARDELGVALERVEGIGFVRQPEAALIRIRAALAAVDDFTLAAVQATAELCGSAIIALALAGNFVDAEAAFLAANVDELHQAEKWGDDPEAKRRREERAANLQEITRFLTLAQEI